MSAKKAKTNKAKKNIVKIKKYTHEPFVNGPK